MSSLWQAFAVLVAGLGAGAVNTVVGSGTLLTFPVLVACGFSPLVANMSNTIGLVPGSIVGTLGYRGELRGHGHRLRIFASASLLGAAIGVGLLLVLPPSAFKAVVPLVIATALGLVLIQPRLSRRLQAGDRGGLPTAAVYPCVVAAGIYGGYFGAAQGVLLMAIFGAALTEGLQVLNAMKNLLTLLVNGLAGLLFIVHGDIAWDAVVLVAIGAMIGASLGARYGRRLRPGALRLAIVGVGLVALARTLIG
jgi:uncharacterized membrane protein YfcA